MDAKEAINKTWEELHLVYSPEDREAIRIVLSLAERMAMYEWWWGLSLSKMVEYGIRDIYAIEDGNCQLEKKDEARVMKAWKENA